MVSTSEPIELRRARDFSGQVNVTVEFIRQNYRKLGRSLLSIVGGPMVLYMLMAMGDAYAIYGTSVEAAETGSIFALLALAAKAQWLIIGIVSILAVGVVNSYVFLYLEHGPDGFEVRDVWEETKKGLQSLFSLSFGMGLVLVAAVVAAVMAYTISEMLSLMLIGGLLLAGIYLMVVTMPIYTVRLYEGGTFSEVVGRSRELMRGKWWLGFKVLGLFYFLLIIIVMLLDLPSYMVVWASDPYAESASISSGVSMLLIVLAMLSAFVSGLSQSVIALVQALHYFNLVEREEGVGIITRIESIGEGDGEESTSYRI